MSQSMDNNNVPPIQDTPKPVDTTTTTSKAPTNLTLPQEIPKLPSLRQSIQEFVVTTNQTLSSLETKYQTMIRTPMTQTVHRLSDSTSTMSEQLHHFYVQQLVYAPYIIVGTSLLVGGVTSVRRGRMAGILSTMLVGGLSYGMVYGMDDGDNETSVPTTKNEMDFSKIIPQSVSDLWKSK